MKAVDPAKYPYYGEIKLDPAMPLAQALTNDTVAAGDDLLMRLHLHAGDSVRIGSRDFKIATVIMTEPDRMSGTVANPENEDDELLESCDEPVALDEPEEGTPRASGPNFPLPFTQTAPTGHGLPQPAPSLAKERVINIPENLDLAPSSSNESQTKQKPSKPE